MSDDSRHLDATAEATRDRNVRDLDAAAVHASVDPDRAIDSLPWLAAAIDQDRTSGAYASWGPSTVIDENTGDAVIGERLFVALHRRAGLVAQWPVGNAGLLHCYGYLLSRALTPYGLKRERWLTSDLARAASLPDDALTPWRRDRTLLARVTDLARAALRDDSPHLDIAVPTDGGSIPTRIGLLPGGVVYQVAGRFVTAFPVSLPADRLRADLAAEPPRLRWNAIAPASGHHDRVS